MISASAAALLGVIAVAVGSALRLILPDASGFAWILVVGGALLLAAAAMLDRRGVASALGGSRGRLGMSSTVRTSLFVGIVVLVNAIAAAVPYRLDLTGLSQFTLTSQTKEVLRTLDTPVEIVSFFTPGQTAAVESYAESLLSEYRAHAPGRIAVRHVDPTIRPDLAREYGVEQIGALVGVVVFSGESGRKRVFGPEVMAEAEHAFTGAILEVTGRKQKRVLFLTGHGEARLEVDYAQAAAGLRDNLFQTGEIDLLAERRIPEDAAAIVVAGPRQPLSTPETELLQDYLRNGGHLLVMLNPGETGGLEGLLSNWWLTASAGRIVDASAHVAMSDDDLLVDRTRNMFRLPQVNFPGAAAILPAATMPQELELSPLAWTSADSAVDVDGRTQRKGSFAIGALLSFKAGGQNGARLAVVGDSDFASNAHFASGNNGDLFVTVLNWLTEESSVISVDRKALPTRRLVLTQERARILHAASIGFLPVLLFVAAGFAWWRRR